MSKNRIVNFICDEVLLEKFDACAEKLALTRTDLLLGLMKFVVQATQDSTFLKDLSEVLQSRPEEPLEYARILASYYKEGHSRA